MRCSRHGGSSRDSSENATVQPWNSRRPSINDAGAGLQPAKIAAPSLSGDLEWPDGPALKSETWATHSTRGEAPDSGVFNLPIKPGLDSARELGFVSGHDFSRAIKIANMPGFRVCVRTWCWKVTASIGLCR